MSKTEVEITITEGQNESKAGSEIKKGAKAPIKTGLFVYMIQLLLFSLTAYVFILCVCVRPCVRARAALSASWNALVPPMLRWLPSAKMAARIPHSERASEGEGAGEAHIAEGKGTLSFLSAFVSGASGSFFCFLWGFSSVFPGPIL